MAHEHQVESPKKERLTDSLAEGAPRATRPWELAASEEGAFPLQVRGLRWPLLPSERTHVPALDQKVHEPGNSDTPSFPNTLLLR